MMIVTYGADDGRDDGRAHDGFDPYDVDHDADVDGGSCSDNDGVSLVEDVVVLAWCIWLGSSYRRIQEIAPSMILL